jgi:hypothetical protein
MSENAITRQCARLRGGAGSATAASENLPAARPADLSLAADAMLASVPARECRSLDSLRSLGMTV